MSECCKNKKESATGLLYYYMDGGVERRVTPVLNDDGVFEFILLDDGSIVPASSVYLISQATPAPTTTTVAPPTTTTVAPQTTTTAALPTTTTTAAPFELIVYNYIEEAPNQQVEDQLEEARAWLNQLLPDPVQEISYGGDPNFNQILVDVSFPTIDGSNNILAQAGPYLPSPRGSIPVRADMQVDIADAEIFAAAGNLLPVVIHELFHALGFGTITSNAASGPLCANDQYTGANAVAEYATLTGRAETFIPVQTGCAHWRENGTTSSVAGSALPNHFDTELMTAFYDSGTINPASRMTIAVLEDLGYTNVNYALAEAYVLGQPIIFSGKSTNLPRLACCFRDGKCCMEKVEE